MTDPRIEAAAGCLFGDKVDQSSGARDYLMGEVQKALAVADAAAWREIATAPTDSSEVLVWDGDSVSIAGRMGKYWWSDAGYSIDNATHWQPLPAPPGDEVKA